jgi:hypothetical protein
MNTRVDLTIIGSMVSFALFWLPSQGSAETTTFQITMSGGQEVPGPGDADGQASGTLTIDDATGEISWSFTYSNIAEPAAMHIHTGAAGEGGGVLVPLNVDTSGGAGTLIGSTTAEADSISAILASPSDYYVNIHNADFRPGAIRGQLGN